MNTWELDETDRGEIWKRSILPFRFAASPPVDEPPTLIVVTGPPGSGRLRATSILAARQRGELAIASGDELRAFHPRFPDLTTGSAPESFEGVARATAGWLRDSIRHAREGKRSLLLEGAFPDPSVVFATAERFASAGFQTHMVVMASRRAVSLLSVASLCLRNVQASTLARIVGSDAHDRAFEATRTFVSAVERSASVDRLTILMRDGQSAFDAHRIDGTDAFKGAAFALEAAQLSRLSRFDATQWLSELHHMTEFAASRRDLPRGVTELLVELHEIALREVIPELHVPSDGKFTIAIEQKTVARLVELRRSLPREQAVDVAAPVVDPVGPERGGISR